MLHGIKPGNGISILLDIVRDRWPDSVISWEVYNISDYGSHGIGVQLKTLDGKCYDELGFFKVEVNGKTVWKIITLFDLETINQL